MDDARALRDELERLQAELRKTRSRLQEAELTVAQLEDELHQARGLLEGIRRGGAAVRPVSPQLRVSARIFDGSPFHWDMAMERACAFAQGFAPQMLLGISQSEGQQSARVVVWHLGDPLPETAEPSPVVCELVPVRGGDFRGAVDRACALIAKVGPERVITVAHSEFEEHGTIAVWFTEPQGERAVTLRP